MSFVKTHEDILSNTRPTVDFINAQMLTVSWETKPEVVARLLPPPLEPTDPPIAMAFVANYPETNFDCVYQETGLFLRAKYKGEEGGYCLSMPVTSDMAMAGGREVFGFPKKIGNIYMEKEGSKVWGWTERRGIRFMEVRANLSGKFNTVDAKNLLLNPDNASEATAEVISYNFKHFPAPEGGSFDYSPRLVKQKTTFNSSVMAFGEGEILFQDSDYDPWGEVEVVRMLGAIYTVGNNSMLGGEVVDDVDPTAFAPYSFLKWDMK